MSTIKVNTIQDASGVERFTARAWVNFNGTGTVAIRAAGNVSSITDNGTGDYTVNFTSAMPDANYAANWMATTTGGGSVRTGTVMSTTTTAFRYQSVDAAGTVADWSFQSVCIFR